jgi:hypothetical protein
MACSFCNFGCDCGSEARHWLDATIGRFTRCTGADWSVRVWRTQRFDGPLTSDPVAFDPYGVFICDDEHGAFDVVVRSPGDPDSGEYEDDCIASGLTAEQAYAFAMERRPSCGHADCAESPLLAIACAAALLAATLDEHDAQTLSMGAANDA